MKLGRTSIATQLVIFYGSHPTCDSKPDSRKESIVTSGRSKYDPRYTGLSVRIDLGLLIILRLG